MKLSDNAVQALAAAYALGTLRGPARRRLERMSRTDQALASVMRRWESALAPLASEVPAIEPPSRIWKDIEARISPPTAHRQPPTALWRAFGLVCAGLASVLLAFFVWISGTARDEAVFVAVLTAQDSVPRMVVSMHEPDLLRVKIVKPWKNTEGKSLELWVLPADGAPRSLGVVPNTGTETVIRVASNDSRLRAANALAVSLEPQGGSPTRQPTGPVLCSGAIAPVNRT